MKIPLKYGLLVMGVMAWTVTAHLLVPDPRASIHRVGAGLFFNILEISGIYFGIRAAERAKRDRLIFKEGLKTGVLIAFVYALSSCLFFLVELSLLGSKMMAGEPGADARPLWKMALGPFLGLFFLSLIFGLIYSTIISFILAKQRQE